MTNDEFRRSFKVPYCNSLGLAVYSCGIQRCGAGHSWGPAVRDHYLIHYIISGKGTFTCSGRTHFLSAGDGFLVIPSCIASYSADKSAPWEYCWVGFNGSDAKRLLLETGLLNSSPIFHSKDTDFQTLLMNICNVSGSSPRDEARMQAGLLSFLAALMDHFGSPSVQHTSGYPYLQKAIKFIDYNYSSNITIKDVAVSTGISRGHLYRIFMQYISMPPNEYLMHYRISKAAALLEAGDLSVGEVAYSTGFSDQLYFSRVFKKHMGIPPSRYLSGRYKEEKE